MYAFIIIIKQVHTIQMRLRYNYVTKFYRIQI